MKRLFQFDLDLDRNIVTITIVSTILLLVDRYHGITGAKALDRFFLYMIIPLLLITLIFRENPKEYGFQLGDWRAGLGYLLLAFLIATPIIWWAAQDPVMQDYYDHLNTPILPALTFLDLIGWEFFFRGLILFGYARKFGAHALWLQAVPFAMAHIGKPELETMSTIFGGFVFGLIAWKTRSFLYPFLIHWYIATLIILLAAGAL